MNGSPTYLLKVKFDDEIKLMKYIANEDIYFLKRMKTVAFTRTMNLTNYPTMVLEEMYVKLWPGQVKWSYFIFY